MDLTDTSPIAEALPEYDIGEELGRGGFGIVLSGRHRRLDRDVAIKALLPKLAGDAEVRQRFAAEARLLASLSHPHVVAIYDYVERDGCCLLVMERLPGGTVWSRFQAEGFNPETACAVVMATCAGLHYAHERGVLHRDLKPENLLLSDEGVLKITDFGIAYVLGGPQTVATRNGEVIGTPAYMAPEQALGAEPTAATDVYSAGVLLFELLSGRSPYADAGSTLAILQRHVYEDPLDLEDAAPDTPAALVDVTMRALARPVGERYASAEAFGVAVAEAATEAWDPEWLSRATLPLIDAGPISEAARPPSGSGVDAPAPEAPAARLTRPVAATHTSGAAPAGLDRADLVPVREVTDVPPAPIALALGALALVFMAMVAAFTGLGAPAHQVRLPAGVVRVAGTDVASGEVVELDLAEQVEIGIGGLPAAAAAAEAVQLGFSVAGVPLPASGVGVFGQSDGRRTTSVEATSARFLAAGTVTGEVTLLDGEGRAVLTSEFAGNPTGSPLLTVPGVVTVLSVLSLVAYAAVRLRRSTRTRLRAMAVVGSGLGAALVVLGWLVGAPEPRARTFVVCAVLAAGAAIAATLAAQRQARRSRMTELET